METVQSPIKSGDLFTYKDNLHVCEGVDEGKIWYEVPYQMELVGVYPDECEKILLSFSKESVINAIDNKMRDLNEQDATSFVYWSNFKNFILSL